MWNVHVGKQHSLELSLLTLKIDQSQDMIASINNPYCDVIIIVIYAFEEYFTLRAIQFCQQTHSD